MDPSPLLQTVTSTPTDFWNDSCALDELAYALEHGATGATTNPVIVLEVLRKEMHLWKDRIHALIAENPTLDEHGLAWRLVEEMAIRGAGLLAPVFAAHHGRKGRLSAQTNPQLYRDPAALVRHAERLASLAPNMQVKIPVTKAGLAAIEEATARGVVVNATVSFTVSQAVAVAEAVERGLDRRRRAGFDVDTMTPVCTLMVGRLDDWLKVLVIRDGVTLTPGHLDWAGIAVMKRAYGIFGARGYRTRLLAAAYRHHLHWSELIGGDIVLTIPAAWQRRFNASDIEVKPRFYDPVDPAVVDELVRRFPDFQRALADDGLPVDAFDTYGPTVRTLRSFLQSQADLVAVVRDFLLPDPDRRTP